MNIYTLQTAKGAHGIGGKHQQLWMNRSIQTEGVFGVTKEDGRYPQKNDPYRISFTASTTVDFRPGISPAKCSAFYDFCVNCFKIEVYNNFVVFIKCICYKNTSSCSAACGICRYKKDKIPPPQNIHQFSAAPHHSWQ
jgi:hypothetical protein